MKHQTKKDQAKVLSIYIFDTLTDFVNNTNRESVSRKHFLEIAKISSKEYFKYHTSVHKIACPNT